MKKIITGIVAMVLLWCSVAAVGRVHHRHFHLALRTKSRSNFVLAMYPQLRALPNISLELQNRVAHDSGIPRAITQGDYDEMMRNGDLVPFPNKIDCVVPDLRLSPWLRVLSPEAIDFIKDTLAPAFCKNETGGRVSQSLLFISSLTRTLPYQRQLAKRNRNARAAIGDDNPERRSSHSTGFTFDISSSNLTNAQQIWLGKFLLEKKNEGMLVEAIFEGSQHHFHVMVRPIPLFAAPC